jgi:DNA helicase-2/ATP-dependent DNA helicase PcrA
MLPLFESRAWPPAPVAAAPSAAGLAAAAQAKIEIGAKLRKMWD